MTNSKSDGQKSSLAKLLILRRVLVCIAVVLFIAIGVLYWVFCYNIRPTEEAPIEHPGQQSSSATEGHTTNTLPPKDDEILNETQPETEPSVSDDPTSEPTSEPVVEELPDIKKSEEDLDVKKDEGTGDNEVTYQKGLSVPDADFARKEIAEKQVVDDDAVSIVPEIPKEGLDLERAPSMVTEMKDAHLSPTILIVLCVLFGVDVVAIIVTSLLISRQKKAISQLHVDGSNIGGFGGNLTQDNAPISIAKIHNIGARPYQEDALGFAYLEDGILAVVADGMGGLSGGDRVSQKIVQTMLNYSRKIQAAQMDGVLEAMVQGVNSEVNKMLGPSGIYKSGSTLLAVLIRKKRFHWITVGDSRIYLFRNGQLTKLNQEHNLGNEMLLKAIRREISYEEARETPKKGRVTSFIGMGSLKYVDKSIYSIPIEHGDRILLMTDGIFNTLPEPVMATILAQSPNIRTAALEFERLIKEKAMPKQDNFSALILGF